MSKEKTIKIRRSDFESYLRDYYEKEVARLRYCKSNSKAVASDLFDKFIQRICDESEHYSVMDKVTIILHDFLAGTFICKNTDFPKPKTAFSRREEYNQAKQRWWAAVIDNAYCHNEKYAFSKNNSPICIDLAEK